MPHTHTALCPCPDAVPMPGYVRQLYWWAYEHPRAVWIFEREWLVNCILLGNYRRLCKACMAQMGADGAVKALQLGCVYGSLSARLQQSLAPGSTLDVVDVLRIQLDNLARKLGARAPVSLILGDASTLRCPDASYDRVLLFFLLHEQPLAVRRATIAEAIRVARPGGRIVIVDYHHPGRWHPLRPFVHAIVRRLKPHAAEFWHGELARYFPGGFVPAAVRKTTYFGGFYQMLVVTL